jgi:hypothetical protein
MEHLIFSFAGKYARLDNGVLVNMTTVEVDQFTKVNRWGTFIHFMKEAEQPPDFILQCDWRVKRIPLSDIEILRDAGKAELKDCLELVLTWLTGIYPDGQGQDWYNAIKGRVLS